MGFFSRLLNPRAHVPVDVDDERWWGSVPTMTLAGVPISHESALSIAAVWAANRVLSETIAMLPLLTYERLSNGGKERAPDHPLYDLLHDEPNIDQDSYQWKELMQSWVTMRGNAYSLILPGRRGAVDQLMPVHPDRVVVEVQPDGRRRYRVWQADGSHEVLLPDEIYHLMGMSLDGLTGVSVVTYARNSLGLAKAAENYGARFFRQDATPKVVLKHPKELSPVAAKRIRSEWVEMHGGSDSPGVAVLEEGMGLESFGFSNEDAQFLASRQFQVSEIARWFRLPPHVLGDLERATFSNIEHQGLELVTYSFMPWFSRWEKSIRRQLILAKDRYFAEFLVDALLRGDILSRYNAYAMARQMGVLSANEIRERENMNPIEGGDEYLVPLNMTAPDQLPDTAQRPTGDEAEAIAEWRTAYERNGHHARVE